MRPTLAALAVLAPTLLVGSPALANPFAKKKAPPAVAVWDLQTDDVLRSDGASEYARIADAIVDAGEVVADHDRDFLPKVRPSEGISVAIHSAERRKGEAWTALRGREPAVALAAVEEAIELVGGYPSERLPEGLMRDLQVLKARVQLASGEAGPASMTLQTALALDPTWSPRREVEHPRFVELFDQVDARRSQAPTGSLTLMATTSDVRVLVHGSEQGTVYQGSLTLELPPGVYRVVGRKAGHADAVEEIRIRPKDDKQVLLTMAVQNSVRFQETVQGALEAPRDQRGSTVWKGLAVAAAEVDARAVLVGRFVAEDEDQGTLHVGLYLPGRGGWGFHRSIAVGEASTDGSVDRAIDDLVRSLQSDLDPVRVALTD